MYVLICIFININKDIIIIIIILLVQYLFEYFNVD